MLPQYFLNIPLKMRTVFEAILSINVSKKILLPMEQDKSGNFQRIFGKGC